MLFLGSYAPRNLSELDFTAVPIRTWDGPYGLRRGNRPYVQSPGQSPKVETPGLPLERTAARSPSMLGMSKLSWMVTNSNARSSVCLLAGTLMTFNMFRP